MDAWKTMSECRDRIQAMVDSFPENSSASDMMAEAIGISDHGGFIQFIHEDVIDTLQARPILLMNQDVAAMSRDAALREVCDAMAVSFISGMHYGYQLALMRIDNPDLD